MQPEQLAGTAWQKEYVRIAPNPGDWPTLIAKVKRSDGDLQDWRPEDIRAIDAATLIVIGDSDIVRPEHAVEMFRV